MAKKAFGRLKKLVTIVTYTRIMTTLVIFLTSIGIIFMFAIICLGIILPSGRSLSQQPDDQYIRIYGANIRYRTIDREGPTVILLHGFGENLNMWDTVAKHLSCARIISCDLIGFGLSDRPGITYNLETHRRYLLAFMDALNVNRAILIGSSMGASIAAWTAAHSPHRVESIVLFAPSGYPGSMWHRWPARMFYRPGILNWIGAKIVRTHMFEITFPNSLGRQAFDVTSSYNYSFVSALNKVRQPALIVWSRGDKRVPFFYSSVYREKIPHAKFIEQSERAGHGVAAYDPERTAAQISSFITEIL